MPGGRGAGAGETAGRIADDGGRAPEPLFEKMVGEVFEAGLHAPIIFAGDEDKAIGTADFSRELFEHRRRLAFRVFLVHPVQHRQADRLGVDQFDIVAAAAQAFDDELRETDAHAVGAIGAVEDQNAMGHGGGRLARLPGAREPASAAPGSAHTRYRPCDPDDARSWASTGRDRSRSCPRRRRRVSASRRCIEICFPCPLVAADGKGFTAVILRDRTPGRPQL